MHRISFLLHLSCTVLVACSSTICSVSFSTASHTYDMCINRTNVTIESIIVDMCSNNTDFEPNLHLHEQADSGNDLCDDYCKYETNNSAHDKTCKRWNLRLSYLTNACYVLSSDLPSDDQLSYSLSIIYDCRYNLSVESDAHATVATGPEFSSNFFRPHALEALYFLIGAVCIGLVVTMTVILCGGFEKKAKADETFMDQIRFMKRISTLVILCCSTVSSLALSNAFGLSKEENGFIAIVMSSIVVMVSFWQCMCNYTHLKIDSEGPKCNSERMRMIPRIFWILVSVGAIMSDASFDFFQGIAFVDGQQFNDLTSSMVFFGTWIGVSDETLVVLMESVVEQCCDEICGSLGKSRQTVMTLLVYFIMNLLTVIEACMCTYILTTFARRWYTAFGLVFQILVLLLVLSTTYCFYKVFQLLCDNYVATAIEDDPEI
eukprot:32461_1